MTESQGVLSGKMLLEIANEVRDERNADFLASSDEINRAIQKIREKHPDIFKTPEKVWPRDVDREILENFLTDYDELDEIDIIKLVNFINYIGRTSEFKSGQMFLWEVIQLLLDYEEKKKTSGTNQSS